MEVALQRLPRAIAKVSVTVATEDVKREVDRAFRSVVGRYNIPGFRRGKVPRPIFERYVGRGVLLQEAAQQIVEHRFAEALQQAAVKAVGEPRINIVSLEDGQPFQFDIEVESKPEIDLGEYQDLLRTPLATAEVTPEDIAGELAGLAKGQAQLVPVEDEPVAMGDRIVLMLKGFLVSEEGPDGDELFVEEENYSLEVGAGSTVEGLEIQLVGLTIGEPATIRFIYPDEHPDRSLAGRNVRFEVTVQEIKRPDVPPVDDELAKAFGYDSEQELRDKVANSLQHRRNDQLKKERMAEILGQLGERVAFDVPDALVNQVIAQQVEGLVNNLKGMGAELQQYLESRQITDEGLQAEFRPLAEARVREELLLEAVAERQGIEIVDAEVIESLRPLAETVKQPLSGMVALFRQRGEFEGLRRNLLLAKAGEYLATTVSE